MAQGSAVAVGQWPGDTQSRAEEPLPTARRPRRRYISHVSKHDLEA